MPLQKGEKLQWWVQCNLGSLQEESDIESGAREESQQLLLNEEEADEDEAIRETSPRSQTPPADSLKRLGPRLQNTRNRTQRIKPEIPQMIKSCGKSVEWTHVVIKVYVEGCQVVPGLSSAFVSESDPVSSSLSFRLFLLRVEVLDRHFVFPRVLALQEFLSFWLFDCSFSLLSSLIGVVLNA
eukprot:3907506-Amphidinium_carterae.1